MDRFIAYYRVSTAKQGTSGLGLEAQRQAVVQHTRTSGIAAEFTEVESGKRNDRPQLDAALRQAKLTGSTLIVAKLDRLARNVRFLLTLVDSGVDVVFCDLPQIPAGPVGRFMLTQMAAVAELEAGLISQRTKGALAAAKARGRKLGGRRANQRPLSAAERKRSIQTRQAKSAALRGEVMPHVDEARAAGATTLQAIADYLNAQRIQSPRGGKWHPTSVARLLG